MSEEEGVIEQQCREEKRERGREGNTEQERREVGKEAVMD